MKLLSFTRHDGRAGYGALVDGGVLDLHALLGAWYPDLKALLAAGALPKAAKLAAHLPPDLTLGDVTLLPVIPAPGQIWCCGLNYRDHVEETRNTVQELPVFFLRVAASQLAHGAPMLVPQESRQLDFEGEIAVIIGTGGRRIAEADAARHIAGYACYNDGTVRDWQRHSSQWAPGKNFAGTGAFGPWMVTADEIPFGTSMTLVTRLNGVEMQRATTDMMIHSIARQIAYVSTVVPLAPGDVIVTGTPGGVGARRQPPVWMRPGDVVEIEVDRLGVLRNPIAAEDPDPTGADA